MEKALLRALSQLGCNEKHIKFYLANLELGSATLIEIAKQARLQRSTAYLIAAELITMGLTSENHRAYKKIFIAAEPDTILQKLEAKHRQVGRSTIALKEVMPELRAAHKATSTRPRVRTFEGRADLTAIWKDILNKQQEILLWSNQESEEQVFGQTMHDLFIRERIDREIPIRVLSVRNPGGEALQAADIANNRHTKLLPQGVAFTSETYIYGDTVAVLDIGKDIFGVITENKQIAASQRAIFEHTWEQL